MKGIFKILSMVILLAALIGAGVLVKKNQETRRGATAAETSAQVLPDKVATKAGQTFTVNVWLNTGKSTDKLTGAEFNLAFDPAKVQFVSSAAQNGYTILAEDSEGGADRWFKMVAMGDEKAGAVNVVKLTFRAVSDGASTIIVGKGATVMVSGQSGTWDVARSSGSKIETGVITITEVPTVSCSWCGTSCVVTKPNMMCTMIAPPKDKKCVVDDTGRGCQIVPAQDKPCSSDANCSTNEYCYQPPMPTCAPGMGCIERMPMRVCRSCTPRLACMDANPACMPDLAAGAPPFCPPTKKLANEGEMCGGLAGIMCVSGLRCEYGLMPEKLPAGGTGTQGMMADQSGVCVKDTMISCNWCGDSCVDSRLKMPCRSVTPSPSGKLCKNVNGKCTIVTEGPQCRTDSDCPTNYYCSAVPPGGCPVRVVNGVTEQSACASVPKCYPKTTPTPRAACGARCTQDQQCQGGMTCAPIWWPCGPMPLDAMSKVQADQGLTQAEVTEMIRVCPTVQGVMPSGYESMDTVKMPSFYGVCRNPKCLSSTNCSCTPTPTPTVISGNQVNMVGMFVNPTVKVGGEVLGVVRVDSGNLKVSAVNVQFTYDPVYFDFVESVPPEGATVLKNTVDRATGRVTVYLSWSLPADKLPTSPNVSQFKLKTKKVGTGSMGFYRSYVPEVSGLDSNGKSTGFAVGFSTDPKYQSVVITDVISCSVCTSGLAKSTGNANCDGTVNSIDFEIWRNEMFDQGGLSGTVKSTWQSDYNCDQKVSGVDFEIWRKTVFQ